MLRSSLQGMDMNCPPGSAERLAPATSCGGPSWGCGQCRPLFVRIVLTAMPAQNYRRRIRAIRQPISIPRTAPASANLRPKWCDDADLRRTARQAGGLLRHDQEMPLNVACECPPRQSAALSADTVAILPCRSITPGCAPARDGTRTSGREHRAAADRSPSLVA